MLLLSLADWIIFPNYQQGEVAFLLLSLLGNAGMHHYLTP
jgi:hypothetical protein